MIRSVHNRSRRVWQSLVAGLMLVGVAANAADEIRTPAQTALIAAETQRFDAQIARDIDKLGAALADELTYTHATGRVQNKNEYLQGFISGNTRYQSIDVTDRVVHVEGNMGMTTGNITLIVGNGMQLASRYTGVYVQRAGHWQLLAWQTTDIRAPAAK